MVIDKSTSCATPLPCESADRPSDEHPHDGQELRRQRQDPHDAAQEAEGEVALDAVQRPLEAPARGEQGWIPSRATLCRKFCVAVLQAVYC